MAPRHSLRIVPLAALALLASGVAPVGASAAAAATSAAAAVSAMPSGWTHRSGASGSGAADGTFGTWRGAPITIGGTWNDSYTSQPAQYTVQPGGEWGSWAGDLDVAVGGIYQDQGETWAAAAAGSYDTRWATSLTRLKDGWGARPGTLYIRFAHEFNGSWMPWKVDNSTGNTAAAPNSAVNFIAAWKRFRTLQQAILPTAQLVLCPNDGSSASLGLDWRTAFPGAAYVDVLSVDTYNAWPWVGTDADFTAKALRLDAFGAPVGIERHRQFASSVGLPFAVSEWGNDSSWGDGAGYAESMGRWFATHAGWGAGKLRYEIYFNVTGYGANTYGMFPSTAAPVHAAAYQRYFRAPAPVTITGTAGTSASRTMRVSWSRTPAALTYTLLRSGTPVAASSTVTSASDTLSGWNATGSYQVIACSAVSCSSSPAVTSKPTAPAPVVLTADTTRALSTGAGPTSSADGHWRASFPLRGAAGWTGTLTGVQVASRTGSTLGCTTIGLGATQAGADTASWGAAPAGWLTQGISASYRTTTTAWLGLAAPSAQGSRASASVRVRNSDGLWSSWSNVCTVDP